MTETSTNRHGLDRRSLLQRTGVVSLGLAASGGLISAATGLGSRPLTASALKPLIGQSLAVSASDWSGPARLLPVRGNGAFPVKERSFQLVLQGEQQLPTEGALLAIEHRALGRHELFFVPDRNRGHWVAVVQDLAVVAKLSKLKGALRD